MPSPQSADAAYDEEHMEHIVLLNRAFADRHVSEEEANELRRHYLEEVTPAGLELSTSFKGIHSITRCEHGVYGYRFERTCRSLWKQRENSNVVDLFPSVPLDAA